MREKDVKEVREERRLRKSYLWFSVRLYLTAVRVSAAELALFHTGATSSSLGYCPSARAAWEHLGEDVCFLGVKVCAQQLFQTIPILQPHLHPLLHSPPNQWDV